MVNAPQPLLDAVTAYQADVGLDWTDPEAVRGECETHALGLLLALDGTPIEVDEDGGVMVAAEAGVDHLWETPEAVPPEYRGDDLAIGHLVCVVNWDGEEWMIDLTAAQFPRLGWTGPRITRKTP